MMWPEGINEALGLSHVDIFLEKAMEEGIADIKLSERPSIVSSQGKNDSNCGWLNNWTKGFIIIKPSLLMESFSNQSCFIS